LGSCLAEALAHVHEHGIIHCALSPETILLAGGQQPVLIDFGSALVTSDGSTVRQRQPDMGLPAARRYESPEQIAGLPPDSRSDLYALGCTLYEMFVGVPPFGTDAGESLSEDHRHRAPRSPSSVRDGLPRELEELLLALLQKNPMDRPDRAEDVANALAALSASSVQGPRPPRDKAWSLRRSRLVGRQGALDRLVGALDAATRARGGSFLVTGASGIGKTRILNELALQARGFNVIFGCCSKITREGERTLGGRALEPFVPFLKWLAAYREAQAASMPPELAAAMAVLAPYEPALDAALSIPSLPPLSPELGRSRALRSLLDALLRTSIERPLLIIIDDLQWADDLTRTFLSGSHHSALEASRVLIVAAHRADNGHSEPLGGELQRVVLGPLSMDEIGTMAREMLGVDLVPSGLAESVYHHSEGNPFIAIEYLRAFVESGLLRRGPTKRWTLFEPHVLPIPSSLQELFAVRLGGLSNAAKQVLEVASVLGREFRVEWLASIVQPVTSRVDLDEALHELVRRHILEPGAAGQYRFMHDKLREAQWTAISEPRRRILHRRAAQILSARQEPCFDASAAELGIHWAAACEPAKAVVYLEAAAQQAAAQHRIADAAELYAMALSQVEAASSANPAAGDWVARTIALGELRGDLLGWSARHDEACVQYDAILPLVDAADTIRRARLERKKGKAYWTLHDYDNAMLALGRAQALLGDLSSSSRADELHEWIEIQQGFFWLHYFARRAETFTEPLMQRLSEVVERHGTPTQKSMFYECAACHTLACDRYRYSARALELAERASSVVGGAAERLAEGASARFVLGFTLALGTPAQCRQAVDVLDANLQILAPIGEATLLTRSLVYLAIAWRRAGNVEATQAVASRARTSAERAHLVPYIGASFGCEAWVQWRNGDTAAARRIAERACAWWASTPHSFPFQWLAKFVLLDLHCVSLDISAASRVVADLLDAEQQRFPRDLDASLLACAVSLRSAAEPRAKSRALRQVLELAQGHSYL
jgi:hypothetical protein